MSEHGRPSHIPEAPKRPSLEESIEWWRRYPTRFPHDPSNRYTSVVLDELQALLGDQAEARAEAGSFAAAEVRVVLRELLDAYEDWRVHGLGQSNARADEAAVRFKRARMSAREALA